MGPSRLSSFVDRRLSLSAEGVLQPVTFIASPNCDARPSDCAIELIVVHNISLPPGEFGGPGVIELFTNTLEAGAHPYYAQIASLRVSAHFFIRRDGSILQFVPCALRAWHAGASSWHGRERCNDFSVGIELEGADDQAYAPVQYGTLAELTRLLCSTYPIGGVAGHEDIAPGRKTDPGPCFDWSLYLSLVALPIAARR